MKKIIIILLTVLITLSLFILCVGARNEDNYSTVIEFDETQKAYPIMNSLNDVIGFREYYQSNNIMLTKVFESSITTETRFDVRCTSSNTYVTGSYTGSYPNWSYSYPVNTYDDVGIVKIQNIFYAVGFIDGTAVQLDNLSTFSENNDGLVGGGLPFDAYTTLSTDLSEGYYVTFPEEPHDLKTDIVPTIVSSASTFVSGMGVNFYNAFNSIFMSDGHLNSLSVFLLIISGIALGYGAIRWITSLFRREAN